MRVGILRPDRLGDTVLTLPVAGWIRRMCPDATVVWITRSVWVELLQGHPWIDEVRVVSQTLPSFGEMVTALRRAQLDVLIFAFSHPKWAMAARVSGIPQRVGPLRFYSLFTMTHRVSWGRRTHMVDRGRLLVEKWLNRKAEDLRPWIPVDPDRRAYVGQQLPDPPRVVLHPSTGGTARTWPMGRFIALSKRLDAHGIGIVWTGDRRILDPPVGVDLQGVLSLRDLVALLSDVDGIVVGATGVFHIAWALGKPVVALMDATHRHHIAVWGSRDPRTRHLILTEESPRVEEVWDALQSLWRR